MKFFATVSIFLFFKILYQRANYHQSFQSSDNLAILLWALGVESAGIPSGRSLILEYRDEPKPSVRALFSEFVDQKPDAMSVSVFHLPGCDAKEEFCPVNNILKLADSETVADWKRVCRVPDSCDNGKGSKWHNVSILFL